MKFSEEQFSKIRQKMLGKGVMESAILSFERAYRLLLSGESGEVPESEIQPSDSVMDYEDLPKIQNVSIELLDQLVVIKLNGGLGTSMGLEKVKSLLEVRPNLAFLDLMAQQILSLREQTGSMIRFLLMNSEASSLDTRQYLQKFRSRLGDPSQLELLQNWAPKVAQETLELVDHPSNPDLEWYPPGHADVYPTLVGSGWLDQLLDQGVQYAFISNSDNLGAIIDQRLLCHFASSRAPFLMEVTRRTDSDRKGGHLAMRKSDGRLILREVAQCPDEDFSAFQDIERHRFFNTNNIWVNLLSLKEVMVENAGVLSLPVIRNRKTIDPRDPSSIAVYQLEQAMGSAIECFDGAQAVNVPRIRFAPVKSTSDLLVLRSDVYRVNSQGSVIMDPSRNGVPPIVDLSSEYRLVDSLADLGVPSLIEARSLKVLGPISFEEGVVIKGDVSIKNAGKSRKSVAKGVYENQVILL
jgi:UDP-N-acetylglucosamine pyrophosphorylase